MSFQSAILLVFQSNPDDLWTVIGRLSRWLSLMRLACLQLLWLGKLNQQSFSVFQLHFSICQLVHFRVGLTCRIWLTCLWGLPLRTLFPLLDQRLKTSDWLVLKLSLTVFGRVLYDTRAIQPLTSFCLIGFVSGWGLVVVIKVRSKLSLTDRHLILLQIGLSPA